MSRSDSFLFSTGFTASLGLIFIYKLIQRRNASSRSIDESNSNSSTQQQQAPALVASQSEVNLSVSEAIQFSSSVPVSASFRKSFSASSSVPLPLIVCGPSGVGKGTLLSRLLKDMPSLFGKTTSHTTRQPRKGEINGVSYHFVNKPDMEKQINEGLFIEYADVHGNLYGTSFASVAAVSSSGKICILEIDYQGAKVVKAKMGANCIFIKPPSIQELQKRLEGRGTEQKETINTRLKTAERELNFLAENPDFFEFVIVNDNLEQSYNDLKRALFDIYPQLEEAADK